MIIDGSSFKNVVSTDMVDKLQLKTKDHSHPYELVLLEKKREKVSKRCPVQVSIGKRYKDEVLCDVVTMDACHFLVGRSWQHDKKSCMMAIKMLMVLSRMVLRLYWLQLDKRTAPNL